MMKKSVYIFFIFCSFTSLFAQKKYTVKQANDLFAKKEYIKAAEAYEQLGKSKEVLQNLGDCYFYNFKMQNAVKAYGQLFSTYKEGIDKEVLFRYANALKGISDFKSGDSIMSKYVGSEQNTLKLMNNANHRVPDSYTITIMSKDKTNGDFGISFYGDKVAFASLRKSSGKNYGWNNRPYLDLFMANVDDKGQLNTIVPFPETINTKQHESSATFSADGKIMYFNRTGDKRVTIGDEKLATVKIYRAEWKDNKWDNVTLCPFSSDNYSVEHPFLTKDGKQLYFASDMNGSVGSMDLYVVEVKEDGTFGQPVNLGPTINTIHREQFPFVSDDGTLYFSSDGHQGYGNLDVFRTTKQADGTYENPLNLGTSINSTMDDFGFILDEAKNKGYFTSNRTGDDNLYTYFREDNKLQYMVEGEVRDKKTMELLPGAVVKLYDDKGTMLEQVTVGKDGNFSFSTEPKQRYKIVAFKDFYIPSEATFDTNTKGKIYLDLQMKVESYYDAEDIINKKDDGSVLIELENIYFDLDKWDIKPQAAKVLDVLVGILKKYPYMEIQIGSHTDSRATPAYNLNLSHKRAASALEYLVQNGIDKKRLSSVGYGETKPLIICPKNDCTDEEHAINRRCTFMILK